MGKRSNMERNPRDLYRTFDKRAGAAISPHLTPNTKFAEPCAGAGDLIDQLKAAGHSCVYACDIEPQAKDVRGDIERGDMFALTEAHLENADIIASNPPWRVDIAHPFMEHFMPMKPLWTLFYADWLFTKQARPFIPRLKKVVAIGRLKWMEGSKMDGKENCVWLYSEPGWTDGPTLIGRL